jgi:hypothetical protein
LPILIWPAKVKGIPAKRVELAHKDHKVFKDHRGQPKDHKVHRVFRGLKARKVSMARRE